MAQQHELPEPRGGDLVRRHGWITRVWHWINAVAVIVLLMSGMMILNAHPRLYWGHFGADPDPAWLELGSAGQNNFPAWLTLPGYYSLADARLWHLAFAWVLFGGLVVYLVWGLSAGHWRRFAIRLAELRPSHLWRELADHLRLRLPGGTAALRYNLLQRLAYLAVLLVLLPLIVLTGMTMSPGFDAGLPWLVDLFGGRQSARSVHFLVAAGLAVFLLAHLAMVVLAGPFNELRSMITGRYRLPPERNSQL